VQLLREKVSMQCTAPDSESRIRQLRQIVAKKTQCGRRRRHSRWGHDQLSSFFDFPFGKFEPVVAYHPSPNGGPASAEDDGRERNKKIFVFGRVAATP
jgi:hypothetical protein